MGKGIVGTAIKATPTVPFSRFKKAKTSTGIHPSICSKLKLKYHSTYGDTPQYMP